MTEKLKPSRYNHFVDSDDGKRLAFNALTCGLAEIDDESFAVYEAMGNGGLGADAAKHEELIKNLKMGGFLVPEDVNELDAIRAAHYRARFGNRGVRFDHHPHGQLQFRLRLLLRGLKNPLRSA